MRHSLSTWVNNATKDVRVVQTLLRDSSPDITVGTYIHGVPEENLKAQELLCHGNDEGADAAAGERAGIDEVQAGISIDSVAASGWPSG